MFGNSTLYISGLTWLVSSLVVLFYFCNYPLKGLCHLLKCNLKYCNSLKKSAAVETTTCMCFSFVSNSLSNLQKLIIACILQMDRVEMNNNNKKAFFFQLLLVCQLIGILFHFPNICSPFVS